jgi:integrase
VRSEPHWRQLETGLHLGYRRIAKEKGGAWTARRRRPSGRYAEIRLGTADDLGDADGRAIVNFDQAQRAARTWRLREDRRDAGLDPDTGQKPKGEPYTVGKALDDYLAWFDQHKRSVAATRASVEAHIRPSLGSLDAGVLTAADIRGWLDRLATAPARRRSKKIGEKKTAPAPEKVEAKRQRRATANRVLTVLKAALNRAFHAGRLPSDDAWRRVKPFPNVDAPVIRYLEEAETVRLVNGCDRDFRPLVRAALLTGCRYGELAELRCGDFNQTNRTLLVRESKSGKPRHVVLTDEGRDFFVEATAGRPKDALALPRPDGKPWGRSHQQRPLSDACKRAKISPAVSFHVLRHTHASILAMKGVPIPVIAQQLGHADTRITSRHYAHLAPSYVAETIRAAFPKLGINEQSKVRPLRPRQKDLRSASRLA